MDDICSSNPDLVVDIEYAIKAAGVGFADPRPWIRSFSSNIFSCLTIGRILPSKGPLRCKESRIAAKIFWKREGLHGHKIKNLGLGEAQLYMFAGRLGEVG